MRFGLLLIILSVLSFHLFSCTTQKRLPAPYEVHHEADLIEIKDVRDWGDKKSILYQTDFENSLKSFIENNPNLLTDPNESMDILVISGGGADGAFGVGVLNGWYQNGDYPKFGLVTGISSGALIAPFAFLGSEYLNKIAMIYTTMSSDDVFKTRSIPNILKGSDSLVDSTPLLILIKENVDGEMINRIAEEHKKGRRLLIGTTNLDAKRLVIWNMGAIASSNNPKAIELFHNIMLASSSMPVAFPPVFINVQINGQEYDEMHVDGGVLTEVFYYGYIVDIKSVIDTQWAENKPNLRVFIIRNSQIEPKYKPVERKITAIAERAVSGLVSSQGVGDLYRIYLISLRDGVDYNLASIPPDYKSNSKEAFDMEEMNRIYKLGFDLAKQGYQWKKYPPSYK